MFEYNTNDSLEQVGPSFDHEMPEKVYTKEVYTPKKWYGYTKTWLISYNK